MSEERSKRDRATNRPSARGTAVARSGEVPKTFDVVVALIRDARRRALQSVNSELIDLYWRIGETISQRIADDGWGQGTVAELAAYIQHSNPGMRGFSPQNLWRMRQFVEAYRDHPELSTLLRELPWSANLQILSKTKRAEEREFYLRQAIQERWSSRELERRFSLGAFERALAGPPRLSAALREMHGDAAATAFKDTYTVEFLSVPTPHSEADLHRGLLEQLRAFLIELGRTLSPALVAEYRTQLPDKRLLQAKLHEFYALMAPAGEAGIAAVAVARKGKGRQA